MSIPVAAAAGPVVFLCDAGPSHGIGHVMRCVALAEEFALRGHRVVFVADLDQVPWARDQVVGRGFGHRQPSTLTDPAALAGVLLAEAPVLVVLDSYVQPESLYAGVRAAGVPTLAVVDGDPAGKPADLWLDQNIGAEDDSWTVPSGTRRLAGLGYALIRSDLRAARPASPEHAEADPVEVFAFFGGTDAFGAAPRVLEALIATRRPFRARVVAADDRLAAACERLAPGDGQSVLVTPPTQQIAEAVLAADVVLSAAGTSSWELLCLGAAAGLVCVAENQEVSYGRAVAAGLVQGLGYLDELGGASAGSTAALTELLDSPRRRRELSVAGWDQVDGRGRERVADACSVLIDRRTPRS